MNCIRQSSVWNQRYYKVELPLVEDDRSHPKASSETQDYVLASHIYRIPTTYRPHTDHVPTTYSTNHIPTICQPRYRLQSNHIPTIYRPRYRLQSNHIPTIYRPRYLTTFRPDQLVHYYSRHVAHILAAEETRTTLVCCWHGKQQGIGPREIVTFF